MNLKINCTDKDFLFDFLSKYVKENKKESYTIPDFGEYEENGEKWYRCRVDNVDIKL